MAKAVDARLTSTLMAAVIAEDETLATRIVETLHVAAIAAARWPASSEPSSARFPEKVDIAVLAADAEGRDRWSAVSAAREATQVPVVCVVDRIDWRAVRALIAEGGSAVVLREELETTLPSAVAAAVGGQLVLPSVLSNQIARPALSTREKQVLGMVVMGLRNAEIAQTLYIGEATVKSHLAAAFAKLGVRSRSEATALILDPEHGLGVGILEISGEGAGSRRAALPGVR